MKINHWKSIGAVAAGFVLGAALSFDTDAVYGKMDWLNTEDFKATPSSVVLLVLVYRFIYNVPGCSLAWRLALSRPLFHAMIIGYIGLTLGILGSVVMWDRAVTGYNVSVVVISIPCAWIGGKWPERSVKS